MALTKNTKNKTKLMHEYALGKETFQSSLNTFSSYLFPRERDCCCFCCFNTLPECCCNTLPECCCNTLPECCSVTLAFDFVCLERIQSAENVNTRAFIIVLSPFKVLAGKVSIIAIFISCIILLLITDNFILFKV